MKNWLVFKSGNFFEVENYWCHIRYKNDLLANLEIKLTTESIIDFNLENLISLNVNHSDCMITDLDKIIILNFSTIEVIDGIIRVHSLYHRVDDYNRDLDKDGIMFNKIKQLERIKKLKDI